MLTIAGRVIILVMRYTSGSNQEGHSPNSNISDAAAAEEL